MHVDHRRLTIAHDKDGAKFPGFSLEAFEDIHPGGYDVKARLKYMDEHGIWAQIVYPNAAGFSATKFMRLFEDRELYKLCIQTIPLTKTVPTGTKPGALK